MQLKKITYLFFSILILGGASLFISGCERSSSDEAADAIEEGMDATEDAAKDAADAVKDATN